MPTGSSQLGTHLLDMYNVNFQTSELATFGNCNANFMTRYYDLNDTNRGYLVGLSNQAFNIVKAGEASSNTLVNFGSSFSSNTRLAVSGTAASLDIAINNGTNIHRIGNVGVSASDLCISGAAGNNTYTTATGGHIFTKGTTEVARIAFDTQSRLGIGTIPTSNLDVVGSINFTGQLTSNGVPFVSGSSGDSGAGGWDIKTATSVATYSNVGIGTTPNSSYLLHLYAASNIAYIDKSGNISTIGDITGFDSLSDARLKDNVVQLNEAECLTKIRAIRPVEFDWNSNVTNIERIGRHDIGVIAQELEEIFPEAVRDNTYFQTNIGTVKTVKYEKIIPLLIGAVKELKTSLNTINESYSNLAARVATLER